MAYTPFNTGNPIGTWGSVDPRDLVDNAAILDRWVNDRTITQWRDRFGVQRLTWNGMEVAFQQAQSDRQDAFDAFLLASGYELIGDYDTDGPLTITQVNQIFSKDGEYWRAGPSLTLPYVTVNDWAVDEPKFVSVGDAALRQQLAQPDGGLLVGFERTALAQQIADVRTALNAGCLNVWEFAAQAGDYIAGGDPATWDWAPAFLAAAAAASTSGWTIIVPPLPGGAPYIFGGSTTLVIDLARFGIEGLGDVMIDASTFTGTYVLQVTSSRGYPGSLAHNSINRVAHIGLFGNKTSGRHGVRVGDSGTNTYNGQISFWNCTVSGFDNNVRFDNNAWRIAFHNCAFFDALSRIIAAPSGLVNAGESVAFYHCEIADGTGDFEIACAGFAVSLHGCSVLNTKVILSGQGVRFDMIGGNMENPGATAWYRYIEITADTVHASMYGTTLVVNSAALQTDALFNIAANSVLDLHSVRIPDGAFQFETGAGTSSFAKGAGTLRGFGCFYPPVSGGSDPNMGYPAQALANGDFETGNINGWTAASGGTAGSTATASSAAAKNGTYGARLDCVAGGTIDIRQTLPVRPGQMVMVGGWGRVNTAASSGNSATISLTFLDAAGNSLLSAGSNNNTVGSFVLMARSLTRLAPRGAVSVRFSAAAGTAANVDYDDLILNIL